MVGRYGGPGPLADNHYDVWRGKRPMADSIILTGKGERERKEGRKEGREREEGRKGGKERKEGRERERKEGRKG